MGLQKQLWLKGFKLIYPLSVDGKVGIGFRRSAEFTQESLAQALNVVTQTIYFWERGERTPALDMIPSLARIVGVPAEHLLEAYPLPPGMRAVSCPAKSGNVAESLPARLSGARKKAGLSQVAMATKVGVSGINIYYWEKGRRTPTLHKIPKLAQIFGCPVEYLLEVYPLPAEISVVYDPNKEMSAHPETPVALPADPVEFSL